MCIRDSYDTAWIQADDPIILSYHGTADETVPFGFDQVIVLGQPIVPLHGSGSIHDHLENNIQVPNFLHTVEGGGHVDIYFDPEFEENRNAAIASSDTLLALTICGSLVNVKEVEFKEVNVYPNPASTQLFFEGVNTASLVSIYNQTGQLILRERYREGMNIESLNNGIYMFIVEEDEVLYSGRFTKF